MNSPQVKRLGEESKDREFDRLISEAGKWKLIGWDFSALEGRWVEEQPKWNYKSKIAAELGAIDSLLYLGTGGGEFLLSIPNLPENTYCTEGFHPNVRIARNTLKKIGIEVVETYCEDNILQEQEGVLPFRTGSIDMVVNRHESFIASEVERILKEKGIFLTQQVGTANLAELNEFLGAPKPKGKWNLSKALDRISKAGLEVASSDEARLSSRFYDVGAIACYLQSAPWQIEDFTIDRYLDRLREIHELISTNGFFEVTATRFYVKATKKLSKRIGND